MHSSEMKAADRKPKQKLGCMSRTSCKSRLRSIQTSSSAMDSAHTPTATLDTMLVLLPQGTNSGQPRDQVSARHG